MKIKVDYNGQCILVPAGPVLDRLSDADGTKLRVLLLALAKPTAEEGEMCDTLNITKKSLHSALSFWGEAGVIHVEADETPEKKNAAKSRSKKADTAAAKKTEDAGGRVTVSRPRPVARAAQLPHYTSEEVVTRRWLICW